MMDIDYHPTLKDARGAGTVMPISVGGGAEVCLCGCGCCCSRVLPAVAVDASAGRAAAAGREASVWRCGWAARQYVKRQFGARAPSWGSSGVG